MPEEKYTRCPECRTVFRVTAEQLELRDGQVRCGHCKAVFDGNAQLVSLAPAQSRAESTPPVDDVAQGPPTVTLRDARALLPPDIETESAAATAADTGDGAAEDRFSLPTSAKSQRARTLGYLAAAALLLVLLVAQAVFHFREAIAAHWPGTRTVLTRICSVAGCTIRPLRDVAMSHLSIDASDLQADPAHRGLLILTATLRNRAAWTLAYPHLELTLTDAQDQVVVRRALAPADYVGGTADVQQGIPPNGEVAVKVFIDASATTQAGYRLYMFYP